MHSSARSSPLGPHARLACLHADGRVRAADSRSRRRLLRLRHRRPPLSRRGQQPVVQRPRSSASADRRGHPRAARPRGPRVEPRHLEPHDDLAGQAAGRSGPAGPGARLLQRRRGHGRRSRAEDGLSVLAAAAGPEAGEDLLRGPGRGLSRRYAGGGQRRRRGPLSRAVPPAVVRNPACARARRLSAAARRFRRSLAGAFAGRARSPAGRTSRADRGTGDRAARAGGGGHHRTPQRLSPRRAAN